LNVIHWIVLILSLVAKLNRAQSNGLHSIGFNLCDWVRLVWKSYSHKVQCLILICNQRASWKKPIK